VSAVVFTLLSARRLVPSAGAGQAAQRFGPDRTLSGLGRRHPAVRA